MLSFYTLGRKTIHTFIRHWRRLSLTAMVSTGDRSRRRKRRFALVTFGEEAESVNLPDEVGHAGPSAKPEPEN